MALSVLLTLQQVAAEDIAGLKKKAEAGDGPAQSRLGNDYHKGDGVTKDDVEAVR